MPHSTDPVIPSVVDSRATFKRAFLEWSSLAQTAKIDPQTVCDHLSLIKTAFPDHPAFPVGLNIKESPGSLSATGSSSWAATVASISHNDLPDFRQFHEITVTESKPTKCSFTRDREVGYCQWFEGQDSHLTILILAWAYVLAARWTEIIPGARPIRYTESRLNSVTNRGKFNVSLGSASADAARWWEAVLAPGQGWLATVESGDDELHSPWSVLLSSRAKFSVSYSESESATGAVATFTTALHYLADYCATHDLADQSRAALATVLCLPHAAFIGRRVHLPSPQLMSDTKRLPIEPLRREQSRHECSTSQLDKLLTLSCNTKGLTAILLSLFFDHEVPCNLASPWLQGIFSALDRVSDETCLLLQTLMNKQPKIGFLWLGATILGTHSHLLELARRGSMEVEILSAVWTNTSQTFMQFPLTGVARSGRIKREDECRLAYLAMESYQYYLPMCPWKPFGSTALEDTDLDVRIHANCQGHGLRYVGWAWDYLDDDLAVERKFHENGGALDVDIKSQQNLVTNQPSHSIPYEKLDLHDDGPSWKATLNIFMWLRRDGFPSSEQYIRRHEWLCDVLDDEEEAAYEFWTDEEDVVDSGRRRAKSSAPKPKLGQWLAST